MFDRELNEMTPLMHASTANRQHLTLSLDSTMFAETTSGPVLHHEQSESVSAVGLARPQMVVLWSGCRNDVRSTGSVENA